MRSNKLHTSQELPDVCADTQLLLYVCLHAAECFQEALNLSS
jgi:hypothetical protein